MTMGEGKWVQLKIGPSGLELPEPRAKVLRTLLRRWFGLRCAAMLCPHRVKSGALYVIECADCGKTQYVGP